MRITLKALKSLFINLISPKLPHIGFHVFSKSARCTFILSKFSETVQSFFFSINRHLLSDFSNTFWILSSVNRTCNWLWFNLITCKSFKLRFHWRKPRITLIWYKVHYVYQKIKRCFCKVLKERYPPFSYLPLKD